METIESILGFLSLLIHEILNVVDTFANVLEKGCINGLCGKDFKEIWASRAFLSVPLGLRTPIA